MPTTLWAADPIIGTWKLNAEKSKTNRPADEQNLKEETAIYSGIDEDMIELFGTTTFKDGSSDSSKWTWPREGGIAKCMSRTIPVDLLLVELLLDPGQWCVSRMSRGRQIASYNKVVSKDGKTMTQTLIGVDEGGTPLDVKVFEKQ